WRFDAVPAGIDWGRQRSRRHRGRSARQAGETDSRRSRDATDRPPLGRRLAGALPVARAALGYRHGARRGGLRVVGLPLRPAAVANGAVLAAAGAGTPAAARV